MGRPNEVARRWLLAAVILAVLLPSRDAEAVIPSAFGPIQLDGKNASGNAPIRGETLNACNGAGKPEFQFRDQNGVSAFYWADDGLAYAIAANAPRDLLLKVAEVIYRQDSEGTKAKLPPTPAKAS